MNKNQTERVTAILNSDEENIPYEPLLDIVNEEIDEKGFCAPIMYPISKAARKTDEEKLTACHQLRSVWRLARWDYMTYSKARLENAS